MIKQFIEAIISIIYKIIPSPEARIKRMDLNQEKIRQKSINKAKKLSIKYDRIVKRNARRKARLERRKKR